MPHALTAHNRTRYLYPTLLTLDTLVADTAVLLTRTLKVLDWAEDALVEKTVLLWTLGTVINGFWLGDFTV